MRALQDNFDVDTSSYLPVSIDLKHASQRATIDEPLLDFSLKHHPSYVNIDQTPRITPILRTRQGHCNVKYDQLDDNSIFASILQGQKLYHASIW